MQTPKIQFSPHEIELLTNPAWILTKNSIMQKMAEGMGSLAERMKETVSQNSERLDSVITRSNAKLSRGENHQGLPYLMLDYPRMFGKDDILAIRTFFWWGKFCSVTLHVKGVCTDPVLHTVSSVAAELKEHAFFYSTGGNEWNHDVTSSDYAPVSDAASQEFILQLFNSPFIKLSAKTALTQWSEVEEKLYTLFGVLLKLFYRR